MEVVKVSGREKVKKVKDLIKSAGNNIFAVSFYKKSDGSLRRMACRLHVHKPSYANKPSGKKFKRSSKDGINNQIVFDVNKITYNSRGKMNGRGAWRTIPLENITRIKVGGTIYKIVS